jgi:APA family basic amino acid/polyamine antiporter
MVLYGLGTTIGAGIYALTGTIAGLAGAYAPVAFGVAALLAAFTAFTFAELSARYPRSAGEAVYVASGLGLPRLGTAVGLLVVLAGSVSAATVTNGFVGYASELVALPRALGILGLVAGLGLLAAWGIGQSVRAAAILTGIEVLGLLGVIWVARGELADLPERLPELLPAANVDAWRGIMVASLLAFYAFLGFEDMVNVAEEVKDVQRTLPLAIIVTLLVTTGLYVVVATVAVLAVPPQELAARDAPLSLVWERATGSPSALITVIGVLAMVNGVLIQMIKASRVLYGLAAHSWLPAWLGRVHAGTRTPVRATALVAGVVLAFALWLPLAPLAEITAVLTLAIFTLVNLALWRAKRVDPAPPGVTLFPIWVPIAGFAVSLGFLLFEASRLVS